MNRWSLSTLLSPFFDPRPTRLARTRLNRAWRAGRPVQVPQPGIFGAGSGFVRIAGVNAVQPDAISCAATGLLLLNAAYDLRLDTWLEQGVAPDPLPDELAGLSAADVASTDPRRRLALAVAAVHRRATARAIGPFAWPQRLGTPPWTLARLARVPGVIYRHRPVADTDAAQMDEVLGMIVEATTQGIPVPLYSGGDLNGGLANAVPRHMVLALPTDDCTRLRIYEPGHGRIELIEVDQLRHRTAPHRALGGWTHLVWVLVPLVR
ncbi:MAG: hypothetical protein ACK5H2_03730 [Beutenbergiaceae bacterium]